MKYLLKLRQNTQNIFYKMAAGNENSLLKSTLELLAQETYETNSLLQTLIDSSFNNPSKNAPTNANLNKRNSLCLSSSDLRHHHHGDPHSHVNHSALGNCREVLVKFGFLEIYEISTKSQNFNAEILIQVSEYSRLVNKENRRKIKESDL